MEAKPQQEHAWLERLVGEWTSEGECSMGPDQPPMKTQGTDTVRSLGGLWILCEGSAEMPSGGIGTTIMTLGFDPQSNRYVGSFIGSMMTYMWIYNGAVDPSGKVLVLETEGPNFTQDGMAKYKDSIEWISDDHRILSSQVQAADGSWNHFMTMHYRRKK